MSSTTSAGAVVLIFVGMVAIAVTPSATAASPDEAWLQPTRPKSARPSARYGRRYSSSNPLGDRTWSPGAAPRRTSRPLRLCCRQHRLTTLGKSNGASVHGNEVKKDDNASAPVVTGVPGLGDDAFYLDMVHTMSLIVKKGNRRGSRSHVWWPGPGKETERGEDPRRPSAVADLDVQRLIVVIVIKPDKRLAETANPGKPNLNLRSLNPVKYILWL